MKIKNLFKKIFVTGAVLLTTVAPAYANEMVEVVNTEVVESTQSTVGQYNLEMTNSEWKAFVEAQGWKNIEMQGNEGDYMVIKAYDECGNYVADVLLKVVEEVVFEEPKTESPAMPEEGILPTPEVEVEAMPEEGILPTPEVEVEAMPEEGILPTPEVEVEAMPEEGILPTPEVEVEAMPEEGILPTPEVEVETTPEVEVPEVEVPEVEVPEVEVPEVEVFEPVLDGTDMDEITVTPIYKVDGDLDTTNDSNLVLDGTNKDDMEVSVENNTVSIDKKPVKVNKEKNTAYSPILSDPALNPKTGDVNVFVYFIGIILAITILVFNNKKSYKSK